MELEIFQSSSSSANIRTKTGSCGCCSAHARCFGCRSGQGEERGQQSLDMSCSHSSPAGLYTPQKMQYEVGTPVK
eukprot:4824867-Amphidinium_carterae.1